MPAPDKLQGKWSGNLILRQRPSALLLAAPELVAFEFSGGKYLLDGAELSGAPEALRLVSADTVIGAWQSAGLIERLRPYVSEDGLVRFVMRSVA